MRSLISSRSPVLKVKPETAHVLSTVSVHCLQCGDCDAEPPSQHSPTLCYSALLRLRATPRYSATPGYVLKFKHPMHLTQNEKDDGVREPSKLCLPTSFLKKILSPSRFKSKLLKTGLAKKIIAHVPSGLNT